MKKGGRKVRKKHQYPITNIRNECGDIATDHTQIKRLLRKYFEDIYVQNNSVNFTTEIKQINPLKKHNSKTDTKEREKYESHWRNWHHNLKPSHKATNKASDQDGFTGESYQTFITILA